ncbi:MAG: hypothetical protein ABF329_07440, partial [Lentimonas sp.]
GGVYIWNTQISQNKPSVLPSSKSRTTINNLRQLAEAEDQYFLEIEAELIHEYAVFEKQMEDAQAAITEERILIRPVRKLNWYSILSRLLRSTGKPMRTTSLLKQLSHLQ